MCVCVREREEGGGGGCGRQNYAYIVVHVGFERYSERGLLIVS